MVDLVATEGLEFDADVSGGTVRLRGRGCPCQRLGAAPDAPRGGCPHDRRLIEGMLGITLDPVGVPDEGGSDARPVHVLGPAGEGGADAPPLYEATTA